MHCCVGLLAFLSFFRAQEMAQCSAVSMSLTPGRTPALLEAAEALAFMRADVLAT